MSADVEGAGPGRVRRGSTAVRALGVLAVIGMIIGGLYWSSTPEPPKPFDPLEVFGGKSAPEPPAPKTAPTGSDTKGATPPPGPEPSLRGSGFRSEQVILSNLVGNKVCAECHPGEAAYHAGSGHARTLRPSALSAVAKWLDGRKVADPERPGATWTYAVANGKLEAEWSDAGKFQCFPFDYAVGSGLNGTTFVSLKPERQAGLGATGLEHRLSYISKGPKMEMTPGQAKADGAGNKREVVPHGRLLDENDLEKCLRCHSTLIATSSGVGVEPQAIRPNVDCERCHGAGRNHVEAARRGGSEAELRMPHGAGEVSAMAQILLCGECHRKLDNVPPNQIDARNPEITRFQPLGLQLSGCFKSGATELKCTSCHDPHAKVAHDTRRYEAVCTSCHTVAHRRTCPISTTEGCINCHMPKTTVSIDFEFHDHWIRVHRDKDPRPAKK